jgi:hypothetical protein
MLDLEHDGACNRNWKYRRLAVGDGVFVSKKKPMTTESALRDLSSILKDAPPGAWVALSQRQDAHPWHRGLDQCRQFAGETKGRADTSSHQNAHRG